MGESATNGPNSVPHGFDPPTPDPRPPTRISWVWYFIGIALVATALLTVLALYIQQQIQRPFTKEQFQIPRQLWETKGPKDYQMLYTVLRAGDKNKDRFFVEVRGGKVQSVILNGAERLAADKFEYHSMSGLFNSIEIFLHRDAQPGSPRTFCRGYFDGDDGHLLLFIRKVIDGPPEHVEIKVEEFRPLPGK